MFKKKPKGYYTNYESKFKIIMKKLVSILPYFVLLLFLGSCNLSDNDVEPQIASSEDSNDYVWDSSSETTIIWNNNSVAITGKGATAGKTIATISNSGNYRLSGSASDGRLVVNCSDNGIVRLILDGINLTNTTTSPIFADKAGKVVLILADNSTNTFTDATSYTAISDDENAAVYSKAYLAISGTGKLTVNGNFEDGITSKDGMVIKSGTLLVNAKDDGIRGKDYLLIHDGNITVNSQGDAIKSDNETDAGTGYITVEKGNFTLTSTAGDGFDAFSSVTLNSGNFQLKTGGGSGNQKSQASTKGIKGLASVTISGGTFNISSSDDAIHSDNKVTINNGAITASTSDDGIHANTEITINNGTINILKSKEGIESKTNTVNGGTISIVSTDDCFNATAGSRTEQNDGSFNYFKGGEIYVNSSSGDALDSNGSMSMSGGTIMAAGPNSQPNVAIDYNGTFNITGGTLAATGPNSGNMIQGFSASSGQFSLLLKSTVSIPAGTLVHIETESGTEIVTFKADRAFYYIVASSPLMKSGGTYKIYTGGSTTGTLLNGIFQNGNYSGGTLKKTLTLTSTVTSSSI